MKQLFMRMVLFSILASVVSCVSTDGSAKKGVMLMEKEISFQSEAGPLAISNDTSKDLIVFAGAVTRNRVLGGIRAGKTRSFSFNKLNLPKNGSILVRAATVDAYEKGKARITEDDVIYTGLVVYDLSEPKDITELRINGDIDVKQEYCIYLTNNSENFVLEVRLEKPMGETIATLAPLQSEKRVFLAPKSTGKGYKLFPQFVYVDPKTNEKTSINVPGKDDVQVMDPDPVGTHLTPVVFEEPKHSSLSYSVAFLTVQNDTKAGMDIRNSRTVLANQRGRRFTGPGRTDVYELDTGKTNEGRVYTALSCFFNEYKEMHINDYKFKPGYVYELICNDRNGSYQYDIRELEKRNIAENSRINLFMEED